MKRIISLVLVAILVFCLVACGGKGGASGAAGGAGASKKDFPLTFKPLYSREEVKTEGNPSGTLSLGYDNVVYDPNAEIVLEYSKAGDELYTLLNGQSDWPAELNDEWASYGYTAIVNDDVKSARTLAVGMYGEKQVTVIRQHYEMLCANGFNVSEGALSWPEDESLLTVPYCMIETAEEVTIEQIAASAYEALYLQAWNLVPAESQGVLVSANGNTYTVEDILKELAK